MESDNPFLRAGPGQRAALAASIAAESRRNPYALKAQYKGKEYDIHVYLDIDQLKHQPPGHPIGSRSTGGGSKFKPPCDYAWHKVATLPVVAEHVRDLLEAGKLPSNDRFFPSVQKKEFDTARDGDIAKKSIPFHFEAVYFLEGDLVIAACHCYPSA